MLINILKTPPTLLPFVLVEISFFWSKKQNQFYKFPLILFSILYIRDKYLIYKN